MLIINDLKAKMAERGMFDKDVEEIAKRIMSRSCDGSDPSLATFSGRWEDSVSDYPPGLIQMLFESIKPIALEYIDEVCPKAWFRPMFAMSDAEMYKIMTEEK